MNVSLGELGIRAQNAGFNVSAICRIALKNALAALEQRKEHTGGSPVKKSLPATNPAKDGDQIVSTGR